MAFVLSSQMKFARVNVKMVGIIGDRMVSGIVLMQKGEPMKIKVTEIEADAKELRESNTLAQNLANMLSRCFQNDEPLDEEFTETEDESVNSDR